MKKLIEGKGICVFKKFVAKGKVRADQTIIKGLGFTVYTNQQTPTSSPPVFWNQATQKD